MGDAVRQPVTDENGQIVHHFLSFLDVTQRRAAEDDLRQLTQELERRVTERTQELTAANAHLSRLLTENEVLLREVDHRAKNSLAIASSLLITQSLPASGPGGQGALPGHPRNAWGRWRARTADGVDPEVDERFEQGAGPRIGGIRFDEAKVLQG